MTRQTHGDGQAGHLSLLSLQGWLEIGFDLLQFWMYGHSSLPNIDQASSVTDRESEIV